ncbi:hypothetical protein [Paludisphaera mucosa]|uniref:Uncharacterized protein n=1 Tax=Paludisphaera mucosa TaxID=3030827 RepID=A0ABT6FLV3_9BACT|nr:hypothetical protein [Paludisphaera mucosa]MDG3008471.1 hypothetical protein [Paludisphaera mucosa]
MSSFKNILKTHKESQEHPVEELPPPSPAPTSTAPVGEVVKLKRPADKPADAKKKRGRPSGKRSDSEFNQVTAYIRKDTHIGVQMLLLKEGKVRDFSELVEDLLAKWVKSRT